MVDRSHVAALAASFIGKVDTGGHYDAPNPFSAHLGRPVEAWCGDFVTDVFKRAGVPLPSMQPGCPTGFAYCPDAWNVAGAHKARKRSWEALPGDLVLFDWNGDSVADHVEMCYVYSGGFIITVGGNSGLNAVVNKGAIQGGVNQHRRSAPVGKGNPAVLGVMDVSAFVRFNAEPVTTKPAKVPTRQRSWYDSHRLLMLKSPHMKGIDVHAMQEALIRHGFGVGPTGADSDFGPHTRDALIRFQQRHGLTADGKRGPLTYAALGA